MRRVKPAARKPRYSGVVAIGMPYVTPTGETVTPVAITMPGIVVRTASGRERCVRRAEFATFTYEHRITARS